jgi:hypothetical protein
MSRAAANPPAPALGTRRPVRPCGGAQTKTQVEVTSFAFVMSYTEGDAARLVHDDVDNASDDDMPELEAEDLSGPQTILLSQLTNRRPWSHGHFGSVERATYHGREVCYASVAHMRVFPARPVVTVVVSPHSVAYCSGQGAVLRFLSRRWS